MNETVLEVKPDSGVHISFHQWMPTHNYFEKYGTQIAFHDLLKAEAKQSQFQGKTEI